MVKTWLSFMCSFDYVFVSLGLSRKREAFFINTAVLAELPGQKHPEKRVCLAYTVMPTFSTGARARECPSLGRIASTRLAALHCLLSLFEIYLNGRESNDCLIPAPAVRLSDIHYLQSFSTHL